MAKSAKKILLVEDNDEIRELLALFMKHLGYKVFPAGLMQNLCGTCSKSTPCIDTGTISRNDEHGYVSG